MAKTKKINKTDDLDQHALLEALNNDLKKLDSADGYSHISLETEDLSGVSEWVGTGSSILDLAISNRPNGGLPVGKICEFFGLEGTGKSAFAAYIIKNTIKKGGVAFYIDTENSLNKGFWQSLGVDLSKVRTKSLTTVEDIFQQIETAIASFRKVSKDRIFTIIVDSVSAASTKAEMESGYDKDGYNTSKAIIVSKALRKITNMIGSQKILLVFNNQVRYNMNASTFSDPYTVPGGKAIAFHSSVRVKLTNVKKINKDTEVVGMRCKATVIKNRLGPPHRRAEFDFYFNGGITDYQSWITVMKNNKIVTQAGAYYKYITDDGEQITFQSKEFLNILNENSKLRDELYKKICDVSIMVYQMPTSETAGDEIDSDNVEDAEDLYVNQEQ